MTGARDVSGLTRAAGRTPAVATLARPGAARPLDAGTRSAMQTRFGHDFGDVRVHADDHAARRADALQARAFAIGPELVFGGGEYQPHTARGQHLLAHELAHVVQSRHPGPEAGAEARADAAAGRAMRGEAVGSGQVGGAGGGVHRQPKDGESPAPDDAGKDAAPLFKPVFLPWNLIAAQLPALKAPSLLTPPAQAPLIAVPQLSLGASASAGPAATGPAPSLKLSQLPAQTLAGPAPAGPLAAPAGALAPGPGSAAGGGAAAPDLPSRIGVTDAGSISLGLRFGLPAPPQPIPGTPPERRPDTGRIPGAGPSALAVSDYQFELLDMQLTGKVPRGFDAVDKGDLIKASFGIVATYIAPDLVASLAKKVSGKPGADYQLDLSITGDFKGGGITFSMPLGKPKKRATRSPP